MRFLKKHDLLEDDATPEEIKKAIEEAGYKVLKDTCEFLGREDVKLFKDGKNIEFLLSQPLELVAQYYNLSVTIRHRTRDAAKNIVSIVFGIVTKLIPLVQKYKGGTISLDDIKDLVAKAEDDTEDDREVEQA